MEFSAAHRPDEPLVICEIEEVEPLGTMLDHVNAQIDEGNLFGCIRLSLYKLTNVHSLDHLLSWVETPESLLVITQIADQETERSLTVPFQIVLRFKLPIPRIRQAPRILAQNHLQVLQEVVDNLLICPIRQLFVVL